MPFLTLAAVFALFPLNPSVLTVPVAEAAPIDTSTSTLVAFAIEQAKANGLNVDHFVKTLACEDSFDVSLPPSPTHDYGVAQIHLASHPDVTMDEALDPYWSIAWAAERFGSNPYMWNCYAIEKSKGWPGS